MKFELTCPRCKQVLSASALICSGCGAGVNESTAQRALDCGQGAQALANARWFHFIPHFTLTCVALLVAIGAAQTKPAVERSTGVTNGVPRGLQKGTSSARQASRSKAGMPRGPAVPTGKFTKVRDPKLVLEGVTAVVASQFHTDDMTLSSQTLIGEGGLGGDELDGVEIVMSCEEAFDVEISDADAESVKTIGDLASVVIKCKTRATSVVETTK